MNRRLSTEARAFARCFRPHENNHTPAKLTTLTFVAGWVAITVGLAFELVQTPPLFYGFYSAATFLILGRIWGLEFENLISEMDR